MKLTASDAHQLMDREITFRIRANQPHTVKVNQVLMRSGEYVRIGYRDEKNIHFPQQYININDITHVDGIEVGNITTLVR